MRLRRAAAGFLLAGLVGAFAPAGVARAADTVDEIHYSYGAAPGSVVVNWRGAETVIDYGPTAEYGSQAVAGTSAITPVDIAGPFREVLLTGLEPDTTYHYRIGATGDDHTLRTAPTGNLRWIDVGDTASTICNPWVAGIHQLIASQDPHVVTHGGDISEANDCRVEAVHQYYLDQEVWSRRSAFQPAWGNHEYGEPTGAAAPGTPRDSLANYKGRSAVTNPQTLSFDTAGRTSAPGCAGPLPGNNCRGEDWGWFRAGGVVFVSYPEPWTNALTDWQPVADTIMAQAQADPTVDFVVTYGHRPAYSSLSTNGWSQPVRTAVEALATKYSPRPDNPTGKYVLNIGHHAHALEVFAPINGLRHITNGTGGQGQINPSTRAPNSVLFYRHPGVLVGDYDATAHTLSLRWLCGPVYPPAPKDPCEFGSTVYSTTISRPAAPPPVTEHVTNPGVETDLTGWTGRYGPSPYVSVTRTTEAAHGGVAAIMVAATAGANNLTSGFNDSPRLVSSCLAVPYTGSVWVRPGVAGQVIDLRLREWSPSGALVREQVASVTGTAGQWHRLSATLTPSQAGNRLAFAVVARDLDAGESFLADDFSLTS